MRILRSSSSGIALHPSQERVQSRNSEDHDNDSDSDVEPPSKRSKKNQDTDVRGKYTDFLSGLKPDDREAFYTVLLDRTNPRQVPMLEEGVQIEPQGLSSIVNKSRTGSWFPNMTSCSMTTLGKNRRHPQWQMSVAGRRSDGIFHDLKEVLSPKALMKLTTLPNEVDQHQPQERLYLHEIADTASRSPSEGPPRQISLHCSLPISFGR